MIDHEYVNEIVCPWCGYVYSDSWELEPDAENIGRVDCDSCGKTFCAIRHVEVLYSTEKAEYGTCKNCGRENIALTSMSSTLGQFEGLCEACGKEQVSVLIRLYTQRLRGGTT